MKSILGALILVSGLCLDLSASAHELGQPPFNQVQVGGETIQFVDEALVGEVRGKFEVLRNAGLNAWVKRLTNRLVEAPLNARLLGGRKFRVRVYDGSEVNGTSVPDGQIFFSREIILRMPHEEAVLALIAHEMAHVIRGHAYLGAEMGLAAEASAPKDSLGRLILHNSYHILKLKALQRTQEFEADHVALELLDNAGVDPALLPKALELADRERLPKPGRFGRPKTPSLLDRIGVIRHDHPLTFDRIRSAQAEIERHGYAMAKRGLVYAETAEFRAILAYLRDLRGAI